MIKQEEIVSLIKVADILKRRKKSGEHPFILFLGISASLRTSSSDMTEVVEKFLTDRSISIKDIEEMDDYKRFEKFYELMGEETPQNRYDWFYAIFGNSSPSPGYTSLTSLLRKGYFNIIISTCVDTILEEAIKEDKNIKYDEYEILIRTKHSDNFICEHLAYSIPKIKIIKLHGQVLSYSSSLGDNQTFRFSQELENELQDQFRNRDILMISDYNVDNDLRNCFSKNDRTIIFVHPNFKRKGFNKGIIPAYQNFKVLKGIDAEFDRFFIKLNELLK